MGFGAGAERVVGYSSWVLGLGHWVFPIGLGYLARVVLERV